MPGDIIAEIETDRATMEVEVVDEGVIGRIFVDQGTENVQVNMVIATLLEDGESADALRQADEKTQQKSAPVVETSGPVAVTATPVDCACCA